MLAEGEMERWKGSEYEFWRQPPCLLIFLKHFFLSAAVERERGRREGDGEEKQKRETQRETLET